MARVEFRAADEEVAAWVAAAEGEDRTLSAWVRRVLNAAAPAGGVLAGGGLVDGSEGAHDEPVSVPTRERVLPEGATPLVHLIDGREFPKEAGPSAASSEPESLVGRIGDRSGSLPKRRLKRTKMCEHRLSPTTWCPECDG